MATQGIQYFQQGKNAEALDLLQRAEQLYDAPVHLIYIARTQAALGKLVDASETYRRLIRTELAAGAPQAFKDAVSDAHKELQQLEPKIPSLRIEVVPTDAKGLQLKVDGEVVSSVVIGINRPTNPGKHGIEAAATDFDTSSTIVDLAVGAKQTVTLQLRARPGAQASVAAEGNQKGPAAAVPATALPSGPSNTGASNGPKAAAAGTETPFDKPPQIVVGARLLAAAPGGKLPLGKADATSLSINGSNSVDTATNSRFGNGLGLLVSAGYRVQLSRQIALTPALAYEGYWFNKGPYYAQDVGSVVQGYYYGKASGTSSVLQVTPNARSVLLGATIEYPRALHAWSPTYYADVFLVAYQQLKATGTITTSGSTCNISDSYTGSGLKFGAGLLLPAAKVVRMAAGLSITAVGTSKRDYWDTCPRGDITKTTPTSIGIPSTSVDISGDSKIYTIATLAVGGDFMIGL
jgi:hypothetical protein